MLVRQQRAGVMVQNTRPLLLAKATAAIADRKQATAVAGQNKAPVFLPEKQATAAGQNKAPLLLTQKQAAAVAGQNTTQPAL